MMPINFFCFLCGFLIVSGHDIASHKDNHTAKNWLLKRKQPQVGAETGSICSNARNSSNERDVAILSSFYNSTSGPKWTNNANWLEGDPCTNRWFGVCCNRDGQITELNLSTNELDGPIPSEFFSITSLQRIDFSYNSLNGSLPSKIALPNLTTFDVTNNFLTGPIPTTWNCSKLTILIFFGNRFIGSLPKLTTLKNLQVLDLSHNYIKGILPEEYGNLSSLKQLQLYDMVFDSPNKLPNSWLKLKNLEQFGIEMLQGELPQTIGTSWPNLEVLQVSIGNLEGGIPSSICNLKNLTSLALIDNLWTGSIPDCIGNLQNLEYLFITQTGLSGNIPDSIGKLRKLKQMDLSESKLSGTIPSSLVNLKATMTSYFSLSSNKLSSIGDGLGPLFTNFGPASCDLSNNPLACPILADYSHYCSISSCSECNTEENRSSCSTCSKNKSCGWCSESPSCLETNNGNPVYYCKPSDWHNGLDSKCP